MIELESLLKDRGIDNHVVIVLDEPLRDNEEDPSADQLSKGVMAVLYIDRHLQPILRYEDGSSEHPDKEFLRTRVLVQNHIASPRRFRRLRWRVK
jgi:hypothetical protein